MGNNYYLNQNSKSQMTPVPEDEYVQAILSIAKKHGVKITDKMILQEVDKQQKTKRKDVWNDTKRKKLLKALEKVKGIWADDKDFEKRQKEREKVEIEEVKKMRKAW